MKIEVKMSEEEGGNGRDSEKGKGCGGTRVNGHSVGQCLSFLGSGD